MQNWKYSKTKRKAENRKKKGVCTKGNISTALLCTLLSVVFLAGCTKTVWEAEHTVSGKGFEEVVLGDAVFYGKTEEFRESVKPPKPVEYYNFYEEHEGYQYYVISGTVKNTGQRDIQSENIELMAECGGEQEDGKLLILNEEKSEFTDTLPKGSEREAYVIVLLETGQEEPSKIHFYYNTDFSKGEEKKYEQEYICELS